MKKTINDLKLGDSVWFEGEEYQFGGFVASVSGMSINLLDDRLHVMCSVSQKHDRLSLTKPRPELKKGQPIWVRDLEGSCWQGGYFSKWLDGTTLFIVAAAPFYNHLEEEYNPSDCEGWKQYNLPTRDELRAIGFDPDFWASSD